VTAIDIGAVGASGTSTAWPVDEAVRAEIIAGRVLADVWVALDAARGHRSDTVREAAHD
jgi:hypothetical protein